MRRVDNARSNAMKKGLSAGRVPKPLVIVSSQTAFSVTIAPPIFAIARGTILAVKEYRRGSKYRLIVSRPPHNPCEGGVNLRGSES